MALGALLGAGSAGLGCGGGSGGGSATFTTSVPGNTPLGGLSSAQGAQLCQDEESFVTMSSYETDVCHVTAFTATALEAGFYASSTDAQLQELCASTYNACLHPDGGAGAGFTCSTPPASCTATVTELTACLDDEASAVHAAAAAIPACDALTRATFAPTDAGVSSGSGTPASCQALQSKCSGGSAEAQAFAASYCALIDPCCASAGLTSQCTGALAGAEYGYDFDATAAASCLAALNTRAAGTDFCGGLATVSGSWNNGSAVIPECAGVFTARSTGSAATGAVCNSDSDCAPGPTGHAICLSDLFLPGAPFDGAQVCFALSATPGDGPCVGTYSPVLGDYGAENPPAGGELFCDRSQGLVCDNTTHVCVAQAGLDDPCSSSLDCDGVTNRCDFVAQVCAARLAMGQACTTTDAYQCAAGLYCDPTTTVCTPEGGAGATCSGNDFPSTCLAGFCNGGTCPSPLSPICS